MTKSDSGIKRFVSKLLVKNKKKNKLSFAHSLELAIYEYIKYSTGASGNINSAIDIFNSKRGVCQDFCYLMISSSIYAGIQQDMLLDIYYPSDKNSQATHAWVELFLKILDGLHLIHQIIVARMRDIWNLFRLLIQFQVREYKGVAIGSSDEELDVKVSVQQIPQQ